MNETPNYYAILPAKVRYDNRLKPNEKLLYAEITALTNKTGKCFASNSYFAKLYDVTTQSISNWISNLVKYGYVNREIIYKEGSKEILNRYITIIVEGIKENFKDNSINNNNIYIYPEPEFEKIDVHEIKYGKEGYSEKEFLKHWKELSPKSYILKLAEHQHKAFKKLCISYGKQNIIQALKGFYMQKNKLPITLETPDHFLKEESFQKYYSAYKSKTQLYDKTNNR